MQGQAKVWPLPLWGHGKETDSVLFYIDVDFAAPLSFLRHEVGKRTLVFNPHDTVCEELRRFTSYYKNIPRDLPAKCQLPEVVTLPNGRTVHRPPAWA